jgi:hypothetical protein
VYLGRAHVKRAVPPMPVEAMNSVKADVDRVKAGMHR